MSMLSRPFFLVLLAAIFIAAGVLGGPVDQFESSLMSGMAQVRSNSPVTTVIAAVVTTAGGAMMTLGVTVIAALFLLFRKAPAAALLLAVTVTIERNLVDGLKIWIGRVRPPIDPGHALHSLAYPSGHAANSLTAYLAVALIAVPSAYRWSASVAALILALLIGLSRVYLGVHWPSDVVGGWAVGFLAVAVALAIGKRSGALSCEPEHDVVGRHGASIREDEPV